MMGIVSVVPMIGVLLWLGLFVYVLLLATRLVNAVEQIAHSMSARQPASHQD